MFAFAHMSTCVLLKSIQYQLNVKPGFIYYTNTSANGSMTVVKTPTTQAYARQHARDNCLIFGSMPPRYSKTRWRTTASAYSYLIEERSHLTQTQVQSQE